MFLNFLPYQTGGCRFGVSPLIARRHELNSAFHSSMHLTALDGQLPLSVLSRFSILTHNTAFYTPLPTLSTPDQLNQACFARAALTLDQARGQRWERWKACDICRGSWGSGLRTSVSLDQFWKYKPTRVNVEIWRVNRTETDRLPGISIKAETDSPFFMQLIDHKGHNSCFCGCGAKSGILTLMTI